MDNSTYENNLNKKGKFPKHKDSKKIKKPNNNKH